MAAVIMALALVLAVGDQPPEPHDSRVVMAVEDRLPTTTELPIALKIAECESDNKNVRNRQGSSASGYWQFIDSTWEWVTGLPAPAMAHPREVQYQAFLTLWDDGRGASHWQPSKYCWGA